VNAIFVGEKRSGKTTLAFDMAVRSGGGVIVFDPKKEFRDWPATVYSVAELDRMISDGHKIIIWRPRMDEDVQDSFEMLADWVMQKHAIALANGWDKEDAHFTLLIDEAYNLQTHSWINMRLMKILSECRPEVLNVFQTFQSVKNVNSDSRSRVSDWYIFTMTLPTDLKRLEEFSMPEVVEQVPHLQEYEYVHFVNEKGTIQSEKFSDSEEWNRSLDYTEEQKGEEQMAKDWTPLQFDTEEDLWDWFRNNNRRKANSRDTGDREREEDKKSRRSSRSSSRGSDGGSSSRKDYEVYKRAS